MKEWFRKHKWKVLIPLLVAVVLAAAFWYGGNTPGARGWKPETPSESQTLPTQGEEEPSTQPSDVPQTTSESETEEPPATEPTETEEPTQATKDRYQTDPVPEDKPKPVEPENATVDTENVQTCTLSITCGTILDNLDRCDPDKAAIVPSNGVILGTTTFTFSSGESVFDLLQRVCRSYGIHLEASWTPSYNSAYIEGIANLYEFDVGSTSGWMYKVNGWFPNYGCSRYEIQPGDEICFVYTCNLGKDVGGSVG